LKLQALRQSGARVITALPGDETSAAAFGCSQLLTQREGEWRVEPVHA